MRVTILGGGGFLGSSTIDRLLVEGYELIVFDRPMVSPHRIFDQNEKVTWVAGDFSNAKDVESAIRNADIVVHLISTILAKGIEADPIYDVQSNVISTLQLLDKLIENRVKKILFISSGGTVYGNPIYTPIDEKHPTNPLSSYAITKLTIEKYLLLYQHLYGLNAKILRVANPYGENQRLDRAQGAVGIFLNKAMSGQSVDIWGDGSAKRDYLHVDDVVDALVRTMRYEGSKSIFNISSGVGTSLNELIEIIQDVTGYQIEKNYLPHRNFDVHENILSNELAQKEIAWVPKISLFNGVSKTFEDMKKKTNFNIKAKS